MTVISLSVDNRSLDNFDEKDSGDSFLNRFESSQRYKILDILHRPCTSRLQAAESPSKPVFAPRPPDHEQCAAMATEKTTLPQEQPAPAASSLKTELKTCSRLVD
jgi:hypothetical protein